MYSMPELLVIDSDDPAVKDCEKGGTRPRAIQDPAEVTSNRYALSAQ